MIVITLVFAILPVVLFQQTKAACAILSFLCPSANFTYFITGVGTFEQAGKPVKMTQLANPEYTDTYRLPLYIHWIALIIHILVFPVLAFATEHLFFSTASQHRKFAPSAIDDPTVTLTGFGKTYVSGATTYVSRTDFPAMYPGSLRGYSSAARLCMLFPVWISRHTQGRFFVCSVQMEAENLQHSIVSLASRGCLLVF